MTATHVRGVLVSKFEAKHIDAMLEHYSAAIEKYLAEDWDGVALKAGKFVEAVTKALMLFCGKSLPADIRSFKAGSELRQLENSPGHSSTVRIVIPKACVFIYEIVNNRGGRHDAGEIDANSIDAKVIIPVAQWIMAEMVRFSSVGADMHAAAILIEGLTNRIYPLFEQIKDRTYVSAQKLGAPALALLLAYEAYPGRIQKDQLEEAIVRHGVNRKAASMAIHRNRTLFDFSEDGLLIRAPGREKAESLLKKLQSVS